MLILLLVSGTLEDVARLLGYELGDVRRLAAVPSQIARSKKFRNVYGESNLLSIREAATNLAEAPTPDDDGLLDELGGVIDVGEAQLMAIAASNDSTLLLSGDKRAVVDLAKSGSKSCLAMLRGKIVSLEAALWLLVTKHGASSVVEFFKPLSNHKSLRVLLSVEGDEQCKEAISSYFRALVVDGGSLLFNPAPGEIDKQP